MRTYKIAPGRRTEFLKIFEAKARPQHEKIGMKILGPFLSIVSESAMNLKTMKGRVRLSPYYFVEGDRVKLRGALATIVPADKKFVHGMRDAILAPSKEQAS